MLYVASGVNVRYFIYYGAIARSFTNGDPLAIKPLK